MAVLLAAVLCTSIAFGAQTLNLVNAAVARDGDYLTARFGIHLGGVEEVGASLHNGLQQELFCRAVIYRQRSYWFDDLLGSGEYSCQIGFDSLDKEFILQIRGGETLKGPELGPLLEQAWERLRLPLCSWGRLERGKAYSLEIQVSLGSTEVPDWVTKALFFWNWEDGPSATYKLDFRY